MKGKTVILFLSAVGILSGLVLLAFPYLEDRKNAYETEVAISKMSSSSERYDAGSPKLERLFQQADLYNRALAGIYKERNDEIWTYEKQLAQQGTDAIGYIEIPKIKVKMLIFHGTEEDALSSGVGHLEGTSLPVGGDSTHSVLVAHTGLKTMRAFDDLPELTEGDQFSVVVSGRSCMYEVESIETVLPYEIDSLAIRNGEDRCTLVTCTPYGLNSHRLLVHGIRVAGNDSEEDGTVIPAERREEKDYVRLDFRTIPLVFVLLLMLAGSFYHLFRLLRERR